MKTRVFLFCLCCLLSSICKAQQRYYGQWSFTGGTGYGNEGWHINLSGEKYLGRTLSAIKGSFTFSNRQQKFQEWNIPISRYSLNMSYFYSLERYMGEKCFINTGGGFFIGAESFHKVKLPSGVKQNEGTKFISGLFINPQLEFILKKRSKVVGFFEPTIGYDFLSRLNHFIYNARIGVKYYF